MSKSIHRNNVKFADQSSSWNLTEWESCDLTAVFEHHKSLWLHDSQQNDAHITDQENIRTANRMNASIYNKQNLNFNAVRYWDRKKINIYWSITRIFSIFYSLFILCDWAFEDMQ